MRELFEATSPDVVIHLAAESHVDRSIDGAAEFVNTNIVGTFVLLEAALAHWRKLPAGRRNDFGFITCRPTRCSAHWASPAFDETTPYRPNSPYSASKAGSDHLVRAWHETHGLPVVISNCSNNFGPYQFPEKLIPLMILNALEGRELPVYGKGANIRDWLYVEDHVNALLLVAERGRVGDTYLIGGNGERTNLQVVQAICDLVEDWCRNVTRRELVRFVADRPGHDLRYAIDATKIRNELGWSPQESFETGLEKTIRWYLASREWWMPLRADIYGGHRLGLVP